MRLPVCIFDLESDMLCPSCQERLDTGQISSFDVEFSGWILEQKKSHPDLDGLHLLRAIRTKNLLILVVKKKNKDILLQNEVVMDAIADTFGKSMIVEGPAKLRTIVRDLISPAVEVGVNSLYLPNGIKESIVMLRSEDRERIRYSKDELRAITSAVTGESVLFQYQDERIEKDETPEIDPFGEKLKEFSHRTR